LEPRTSAAGSRVLQNPLPGFLDHLRLLGFELGIGYRRQLLHVDLLCSERIGQLGAGPQTATSGKMS